MKSASSSVGDAAPGWPWAAVDPYPISMARRSAVFTQAADLLLRDAKGYAHNSFKIDLARRGIVRALTQATRGTPQSQSSKKIR